MRAFAQQSSRRLNTRSAQPRAPERASFNLALELANIARQSAVDNGRIPAAQHHIRAASGASASSATPLRPNMARVAQQGMSPATPPRRRPQASAPAYARIETPPPGQGQRPAQAQLRQQQQYSPHPQQYSPQPRQYSPQQQQHPPQQQYPPQQQQYPPQQQYRG